MLISMYVDALAVHLALEPAAVAAPGGAVHRHGALRGHRRPLRWRSASHRAVASVRGHDRPSQPWTLLPGLRPLSVAGVRMPCMSARPLCPAVPARRRRARRARPRAARRRDGPRRPGVRAGRRRHRQDPGDHPPDRLRRARRRHVARAGARGHLHRPGRRRDARPAARSSAPAACRRAPSTPPRCASCSTSGRAPSAARCPRCRERKVAARRRGGRALPASVSAAPSCATSPARSSGPRSPRRRPGRLRRGGRRRPGATRRRARRRPRSPASTRPTRSSSGPRASSTSRTCCC